MPPPRFSLRLVGAVATLTMFTLFVYATLFLRERHSMHLDIYCRFEGLLSRSTADVEGEGKDRVWYISDYCRERNVKAGSSGGIGNGFTTKNRFRSNDAYYAQPLDLEHDRMIAE